MFTNTALTVENTKPGQLGICRQNPQPSQHLADMDATEPGYFAVAGVVTNGHAGQRLMKYIS
jgi:hypothetical protein